LPTGAMTLLINLGGQPIRIFRDEGDETGISFRDFVVWGPRTRYAVRDSTRTSAVVGVQFRPGMAGAVLMQAGATLVRPAEDHFYGEPSGMILDPFGHEWMLGHSVEQVSPHEMQRRYAELMKS
jgi:hypothetical protein